MSEEILIEETTELKNTQGRRWMLTINNPTQSDDEIKEYIQGLEHFKYGMFQREKGHEMETEHIQMFLIFSIGKRFSTIKTYFPTAHIEQSRGTNAQCRDYCSKSDTRVSGPYEIGEFAEERSRSDIKGFMQLVDAGASDYELAQLYPSLFLKECNKLTFLRNVKNIDYSKQRRDVDVYYIYGSAGSGKTTFVEDLTIYDTCFSVDTFDNSAFTGYKGEETLIIDEFKGQFSLQFMNRLLDGSPVKLRGLNSLVNASFKKVYIISNYKYKDLYKKDQEENIEAFNGFARRLHNIFHIYGNFQSMKERETIFEDIPKEEQKPFGRSRRVKQVIEYDKYGMSKIIFDKDFQKMQQVELTEIEDVDLPF